MSAIKRNCQLDPAAAAVQLAMASWCGASGGAMAALGHRCGLLRLRQQLEHIAGVERRRAATTLLARHHPQARAAQPHLGRRQTVHGTGAHRAMNLRFETFHDCWHVCPPPPGKGSKKQKIMACCKKTNLAIGRRLHTKSFSPKAAPRKLNLVG